MRKTGIISFVAFIVVGLVTLNISTSTVLDIPVRTFNSSTDDFHENKAIVKDSMKVSQALSKVSLETILKANPSIDKETLVSIALDDAAWIDEAGRIYYVDEMAPAESATDTTNVNAPVAASEMVAPLDQTFMLESRPGSKHTIYLDFLGGIVTGTSWNGGATFDVPVWDRDGKATFNDYERAFIQEVWALVAEDYAPFDVNVTTRDLGSGAILKTNASDDTYGMIAKVTRDIVSSPYMDGKMLVCSSCAGVAYMGVFNKGNPSDQPAWIFTGTTSANYAAATVSHEIGHTFGLRHDGNVAHGDVKAQGYYAGQGIWAPIMGGGSSKAIAQWNNGDYGYANEFQDDVATIAANGAPYISDEAGSLISTAAPLDLTNTKKGVITTRDDVDVYSFTYSAGALHLQIDPSQYGANLDIKARLLDSAGNELAVSNNASTSNTTDPNKEDNVAVGMSAYLDFQVTSAGTYYLEIQGVGEGDPLATGYSDYGSIGAYSIYNASPKLKVDVSGSGSITASNPTLSCASSCETSVASNTVVTVTANPSVGWDLAYWVGPCEFPKYDFTASKTCSIRVDQARFITAIFMPIHTITVSASGPGHIFASHDYAWNSSWSEKIWSLECGTKAGTAVSKCSASDWRPTVTLYAKPDLTKKFTGWGGACSGTSPSCTVLMDDAKNVTATFITPVLHTLTISKVGAGTITSDVAGITCGTTCTGQFAENDPVVLTATPASNYRVASWTGDCAGSALTCTLTMPTDTNITVTFEEINSTGSQLLSVSVTGNGSISSTPAGISCPGSCSYNFTTGTQVTLTALPMNGYEVAAWGGDCSGRTLTCSLDMTIAHTVSVSFRLIQFTLDVTVVGMGIVQSTPQGIACPNFCSSDFLDKTVVTLDAYNSSGWYLQSWSGACSGSGWTCTVTMSEARSVVLTFAPITHKVTVSLKGSGSGTITSSPSGMTCSNGTCEGNFNQFTIVTLTAVPDPSSRFFNWPAGACQGSYNNTSCQVAVNYTDVTTDAKFVPSNPLITVVKTGGGTITSTVGGVSPANGLNCGVTCSAPYAFGVEVQLVATADPGQSFSSWTGCGYTNGNTCWVTPYDNLSVTATFVQTVAVTGLTISQSSIALNVGGSTGTITATVAPANATNKTVYWYSYNSAVATVSNGVITPKTVGSASILAWTAEGNFSKTITVTVTLAPQTALSISNAITSDLVTRSFNLTTAGGSGSGSITFAAVGSGCAIANDVLTKSSPGTCSVTATKAASGNYASATSASTTFTFNALEQNVLSVSNADVNGRLGEGITLVSAGGSGNGNVSWTVVGLGCSITDGVLSATQETTCDVTVSKAAEGNYAAATSASKRFTFLAFTNIALAITNPERYISANQSLILETNGGNGTGAITFEVTGNGCSVANNVLSASRITTCSVVATKSADSRYPSAVSSPVVFSFEAIPQATLVISNAITFGNAGAAILLSTAGGSGSGVVSFSVSGVGCSVSSGQLNTTNAGDCAVTAHKAASGIFDSTSSESVIFRFNPISQNPLRISSTSATGRVGSSINLTISGGSGNGAVSLIAEGEGCSVSGFSLSATQATTCVITATKAASGIYDFVNSESQSFEFIELTNITLAITNTNLSNAANSAVTIETNGGNGTGLITFAVTGSGCTLANNVLTVNRITTCSVTARKAADQFYNSATSNSVTFEFFAAPQSALSIANSQVVNVAGTAISLATVGGTGTGALSFSVRGSECSITGSTLTATAPGECQVTATKSASGIYAAKTTDAVTFTFIAAAQVPLTISNSILTNRVNIEVPLSTTGGSGLGRVTYEVVGNGCLIRDGQLTATDAATCEVTAKKSANGIFDEAISNPVTFTFTPDAPIVFAITNAILTATAAELINIETNGGNGIGAITFSVSGAGCSLTGATLRATKQTVCFVTALKAGDIMNPAVRTAAIPFTFTLAPQAGLNITNSLRTINAGSSVNLVATGGSGSGLVKFQTNTAGCSIAGAVLRSSFPTTCKVIAIKAASGIYLATSTEENYFTFVPISQTALTISNSVRIVPANANFALTTKGGSGTGIVQFSVSGTGCYLNGTSLRSSQVGTCTVRATKAAQGNYLAAESPQVTFTFTSAAQTTLSISNANKTSKFTKSITLTTKGGSGTGELTFEVTGAGCTLTGNILSALGPTTCTVFAVKAGSGIYNAVRSSASKFTFTK